MGANFLKGGEFPRNFAPREGDITRNFAPLGGEIVGGAKFLGHRHSFTKLTKIGNTITNQKLKRNVQQMMSK
jgi:hypothetical protein